MSNITQKATIARIPLEDIYIEGYQTKVLKRYPIAIDFKDGVFRYRWVGVSDPDFTDNGYYNMHEDKVSLDESCVFEISSIIFSTDPSLEDQYSVAEQITSPRFLKGLYRIVHAFEYDESWYNQIDDAFLYPISVLEGLFAKAFFWEAVEPLLPTIVKSNPVEHVPPIPKEKKGYMYAIQLDGFIKVGFSTNVKNRMSTYRTSSKIVELICKEPATMKQELTFHKEYNNGSEKYDTELGESIRDYIIRHLRPKRKI